MTAGASNHDPTDRRASEKPSYTIRQATSAADLGAVADCFQAYATWFNLDLSFQDFASEVANLPGKYAPPTGALLLARDDSTSETLGCIALRPLALGPEYLSTVRRQSGALRYCEVKRLWVEPSARGRGVAKALVRAAIAAAVAEDYDEALLDTLQRMTPALTLYRSEGFVDVKAYYYNPHNDVVFLAKRLKSVDAKDGGLVDEQDA